MFYSARYPKSDWTELSCLPWKYPRPPKRLWAQSKPAGRPCDSYTRPRKDDSVVAAAAVKVSSEGQWKAEAAHVQKWALIQSRAHATAAAVTGIVLELKNTRRRAATSTGAGGAYASSSYFGCQVQWALLFPPTTSHITGNCNTLKDNLILSLIRYVVAIKS